MQQHPGFRQTWYCSEMLPGWRGPKASSLRRRVSISLSRRGTDEVMFMSDMIYSISVNHKPEVPAPSTGRKTMWCPGCAIRLPHSCKTHPIWGPSRRRWIGSVCNADAAPSSAWSSSRPPGRTSTARAAAQPSWFRPTTGYAMSTPASVQSNSHGHTAFAPAAGIISTRLMRP